MAVIASDACSGSNGDAPSSRWTGGTTPTAGGAVNIQSGKLRFLSGTNASGGATDCASRVLTGVTAQQGMELRCIVRVDTSGNQSGVVLRCDSTLSDATVSGYALSIDGGTALSIIKFTGGTGTFSQLATTAFTQSLSTDYWLLARVTGTSSTLIQAKIWAVGTTEPGSFTTSFTDTTSPITSGGIGAVVFGGGGTAKSLSIGSVTVTDAGGGPIIPTVVKRWSRWRQHLDRRARPMLQRIPDQTEAWPTAWANRATQPAVWLAIGDSITEGQGASDLPARWITQCLNLLRSRGGKPTKGGAGYLHAAYYIYGPDSVWTTFLQYNGGSVGGALYIPAIGGAAAASAADPDGMTWTVTGTSVDLWYVESTAPGFYYSIDGGTPVLVTPGNNFPTPHKLRISLGASGVHTVDVWQTGTGVMGWCGVTVYDGDENAGVVLIDGGHVAAFTADPLTTWGNRSSAYDLMATYVLAAPDVVTLELGVNDWSSNVPPATAAANLLVTIQLLQSLPKRPTIWLVAPAAYDDGTTQTYRWTAYLAAMQAVAAQTGIGFVDVGPVLGSPTNTALFSADQIHPNDAGHALMGQFMSGVLGGNPDYPPAPPRRRLPRAWRRRPTTTLRPLSSGPTVPSVTATETLTVTDTAARTQAGSRAVTETLTTSEVATAQPTKPRSAADAITTVDVVARTSTRPRATTDTVSITDGAVASVTRGRTAADTLTTSEGITWALAARVAATDGISTSEVLTRSRTSTRAVTDQVTVGDVATGPAIRTGTTVDTLQLADAVPVRSTNRPRAAGDTLTIADAAARAASTTTRTVVDSLTATDATSRATTGPRSTLDALGVADVLVRAWAPARTTVDTLGAGDTARLQVSFVRTVADAAALADTLTRTVARPRTAGDTLTVFDATGRALTLVRGITDPLTLTDTAGQTILRGRTITDALTATDAVTRAVLEQRAAADSWSTSDVTARSVQLARAVPEGLGVVDVAARARAGGRSVVDVLGVADAAAGIRSLVRGAGDAVVFADVPGRTLVVARSSVDAVAVADAVARGLARVAAVVDGVALVDVAARPALARARAGVDVVAVADVVGRVLTLVPRGGVDSLTLVEATTRVRVQSRTATDGLTVVDVVVSVRPLRGVRSRVITPGDVGTMLGDDR